MLNYIDPGHQMQSAMVASVLSETICSTTGQSLRILYHLKPFTSNLSSFLKLLKAGLLVAGLVLTYILQIIVCITVVCCIITLCACWL